MADPHSYRLSLSFDKFWITEGCGPKKRTKDVTESPHVVVAVRLRPLNDAELWLVTNARLSPGWGVAPETRKCYPLVN